MLYAFGIHRAVHHRRSDRAVPGLPRHRRARHRHLLRRRPLPLHHGRRHGRWPTSAACISGGQKFPARMYPEGWAQARRPHRLHRIQPHLLPAVPARLHGHAAPLSRLSRRSSRCSTCSPPRAPPFSAVGYLLPMIYFLWSMRYGKPAPDNPWNAAGLEWMTPSPPPTSNFEEATSRDLGSLQLRRTRCDSAEAGGSRWPLDQATVIAPASTSTIRRCSITSPTEAAAAKLCQPRHVDLPRHRKSCSSAACSAPTSSTATSISGISPAASQQLDIELGAINTAVLICSSLTVVLGSSRRPNSASAGAGRHGWSRPCFLGLAFLGIKADEYHEKFEKHHVPGPSFSFTNYSDQEQLAPDRPISMPIPITPKCISRSISP